MVSERMPRVEGGVDRLLPVAPVDDLRWPALPPAKANFVRGMAGSNGRSAHFDASDSGRRRSTSNVAHVLPNLCREHRPSGPAAFARLCARWRSATCTDARRGTSIRGNRGESAVEASPLSLT